MKNGHTAKPDSVSTQSATENFELTSTAWTILGFLSLQPRSGYEIREAAKRSVRFFWGISDGQLYPQLKILEDLGLIEAPNGVEGPRSRQRWQLTDTGRKALRKWLVSPSAHLQIRDENLVKFLFAAQEGPELLLHLIRERRESFTWFLNTIKETQPGSTWESSKEDPSLAGPLLLQRYGIGFAETVLDWCDQAEASLLSPENKKASNDKEESL
ncbi:PadR family transcriptional regulator [Paenibacillus silvae]|uniref:PadR family transcriptional regulator n=1 Tax=Paenibacillus silvae TaxID=1325358 RepID=UPI002003573A|nr:PadR family transcriptional regulator [Paenibacillus silvae]MCK6150585.1 PadR family transcriptional regulator [Paenibacillus silvae]MCK6268845.1 PadR family transcriptional regulator [Paenibacillus silvae]MCK6270438.1 PadR family transcriptional regulator [Paenibacillus silvae]